jgi:DNA-binding NarL/FixJ family response regulator
VGSDHSASDAPVSLALVDDYEVVLRGIVHMLAPFSDRVVVVQIDANEPITVDVDIALYDTFGQAEVDREGIDALVANPRARRVAVYTWAFDPRLIETALAKGAHGYLSKTLPAIELVDALVAINRGEVVVSPEPPRVRSSTALDWPGRSHGLTERESEVIALITQGHSNSEIAKLMYLSGSSIKMYVRSSYRKMGVSSRTQAVLWGLKNGFAADNHQIDRWR